MGCAEQLCAVDGPGFDSKEGAGVDFGSPEFAVVLVGAGVRHADAIEEFRAFIEKFNFWFVSSYGGADVLPDHVLRKGVLGTHGTQSATDVVRKADTLIVLGCRLSINTRGYNDEYTDGKRLIIVDIDPNEHGKNWGELVQEDVKTWLLTQSTQTNG
jgi:thiamine pyrophosphate-dependent acetolactate synthase large subunit-like protein